MATILLEGLSKHFGDVVAVNSLDLEIVDKEFLVLLGPSGCGKTTTLNMIAGLEEPTEGAIYVDGVNVRYVPPHKRNLAMVFQSYTLYPHMSVYNNIGFPLRMRGIEKLEADRRVREAAGTLRIVHLLDRKPSALSGGERQRVALGRAIVRNPGAFLMDEPLSNLDALVRLGMRGELKKLHQRLGTTVVYVTHDQAEAMTLADRVVLMKDGKIQQMSSPYDIYHRPENLFVAGFIGSPPMNIIEGVLRDERGLHFHGPSLDFSPPQALASRLSAHAGKEVWLGVRPEDILVGAEAGGSPHLEAEVLVVEPMGADLFLEIDVGGMGWMVRTGPHFRIAPGEKAPARLREDKVYFFDSITELAL